MKPDPDARPDPLAALRRAVQDAAEQLAYGESDTERTERLAMRTAQLARTVESNPNTPDAIGIRHALSFHMNAGPDEPGYYGWPIARVRGIARVGKITPVPSAPRFYRGVVNWRGQVLSALDLNVYFGQPPGDEIPPWMIVIGDGRLEIGVLADNVFDVVLIRADELSDLDDPGANLLNGVTMSGLGLLDADRLLSREWERIHVRHTDRNFVGSL
ncbi:MAG: chemotaxis protein CheW [Aggregatilineales bacterium]